MSRIVVLENVTLDGVMQAPGRPDEDTRGGFAHGGWAVPYQDPVMFGLMAEGMSETGSLLFGRRTYEDFFRVWAGRSDNPFSEVLDNSRKYVATRTLRDPLAWQNSTRLEGEAAEAVARLRGETEGVILIMGSGELVGSLLRGGLVDELVLMVYPLVLGSGRRLFPDDSDRQALTLVKSVPTTTGVIVATYRRAE
jgi:dihydrofolate reductase